RCLRNECAELVEALDGGDKNEILDELGDVMMNVFLQVAVAEEKNEFTLPDVWAHVIAKMIRRHEHVFGSAQAATPDEVLKLWEKIKAAEPGRAEVKSLLDGVQQSLSALDRAEKLQSRAAKGGFDWPDASGAAAKVAEESREVADALAQNDENAVDEELGDLLFAVVNLTRKRGRATAEELLRRANSKFERRFRRVEEILAERGTAMNGSSPADLDRIWEEVKKED
ncbi:MAG: nucleoside triphosphate pyrophosphohydrolase, partial [Victivallaceae bacterium]|nr:nucleoside triphosphate pyrophosphohydrolase [Victivallaceae bacterium]